MSKTVGHFRELLARGSPPLAPLLLVEFRSSGSSAREFRTVTATSPAATPPLPLALNDPEARLVVLEKTTRNPYVGFLFVGRAATNDVILRDASVSKSHAVFENPGPGRWLLKDNRSHNGTFVNGGRLREGERAPVSSGALLAFGSYATYFVEPEELARILR